MFFHSSSLFTGKSSLFLCHSHMHLSLFLSLCHLLPSDLYLLLLFISSLFVSESEFFCFLFAFSLLPFYFYFVHSLFFLSFHFIPLFLCFTLCSSVCCHFSLSLFHSISFSSLLCLFDSLFLISLSFFCTSCRISLSIMTVFTPVFFCNLLLH